MITYRRISTDNIFHQLFFIDQIYDFHKLGNITIDSAKKTKIIASNSIISLFTSVSTIAPKATALIFNIIKRFGKTNGKASTEKTVVLLFDLIDNKETKLNTTLTPKLPIANEIANNVQF